MFYVQYRIEGFEGLQKAGPYLTREIANGHRDDIAGYILISDVSVEEELPLAPEPKSVWDRLTADDE